MARKRHHNHRLVKNLRSYTVEEIARLFGAHRNTVRSWIKVGLQTLDQKRPVLVLGAELIEFLRARQAKSKHPCGPQELYCFGCRAPKSPAGAMIDYQPITQTFGNLTAICPECGCLIHRIISMAKLEDFRAKDNSPSAQAVPQLREIIQPSVNSDFKGDVQR